jgi:hypothetical protein
MKFASQILAEERSARRHAHRMAREVSHVLENPLGAFEEMGAGTKLLLALAGAGVVGGGIYYVATKKPAATAAPPVATVNPGTTSTAPPPANAAPPTVMTVAAVQALLVSTTIRPAAPNTFGTPTPPGPNITLVGQGSQTKVLIANGDYLTMTLPAGAKWRAVLVTSNASSTSISVPLNGDVVSSVSIPISTVMTGGISKITAAWTDSSGAPQGSGFTPALEH